MKYLKEYIEWKKNSSDIDPNIKDIIEHILVRVEDEMSDVVEMEVDYEKFIDGYSPYIDFFITNDYWNKSQHLTEFDEDDNEHLDVSYEVRKLISLLEEEFQMFKEKYYLDYIKPDTIMSNPGKYILCAKIKKIESKIEKIEYGTFYKNIKNTFHSDEFESLFTPLLDEYGSDNCLLTFNEWCGTIRVLFKLKTNIIRDMVFDGPAGSHWILQEESNRLKEASDEVLKDIEIHYPLVKLINVDFINSIGIDNVHYANETYSTTIVSFDFKFNKLNEMVEDISGRDNQFVMDVFGLDKEQFENDIATPLEDEFGEDNILISFGYWPGDQMIEVRAKVKTSKFYIIGNTINRNIKGNVRSFLIDMDMHTQRNYSKFFDVTTYEISRVYPNSEIINDINYSDDFYVIKLFKNQ